MQENQNPGTSLATLPPAERAVIALESTKTEAQLRELVTYSAGIVSVCDKDSREEAHRAGMNLKNARVAIGKVGKAARDDANAFCSAVIAEEKRLVAIVSTEEERVFGLRDGYDARVKAEKEEAERRERERVARIRAKIDTIKGLVAASFRDSAAEIGATLADLDTLEMGEAEFAEFAGEASDAKAQALTGLRDLLDKATAAEAEAARLAAERLAQQEEADRLRAEREALEAERRALAEATRNIIVPPAGEMVTIGTVPAGGTAADLVLPDGRRALDAARDVAPEDRPVVITYPSGAFVGMDLDIDAKESPATEDAANFRAATRALLATHSTEQARIIFDNELQRFLVAA